MQMFFIMYTFSYYQISCSYSKQKQKILATCFLNQFFSCVKQQTIDSICIYNSKYHSCPSVVYVASGTNYRHNHFVSFCCNSQMQIQNVLAAQLSTCESKIFWHNRPHLSNVLSTCKLDINVHQTTRCCCLFIIYAKRDAILFC